VCLFLVTMIFLDIHNKIVEETVKYRLKNVSTPDNLDITCADFDGVTFHLSTDPNDKTIMFVSVSTRCFEQLKKFGVDQRLKNIYKDLLTTPESNYDATLRIDLKNSSQDKPEFYKHVAMLKRHALSAPFHFVFDQIDKKGPNTLSEVKYRAEEAFYLKPEGTGCTAIFSVLFRDADDVLYSKVFLQEFADARKNIRGSPTVNFSLKEPPGELNGVRGLIKPDKKDGSQGYVSFSLFPDHIGPARRETTIDQMLIFRDYLHYHLKCSKAYLHMRMRNRVVSMLQVLNRAKQPKPEDQQARKKTMGGKTFVKK